MLSDIIVKDLVSREYRRILSLFAHVGLLPVPFSVPKIYKGVGVLFQ